jgi:hypothetical protein
LIRASSGEVWREAELSGLLGHEVRWSPSGDELACILYDLVNGNDINYRIEIYTLADESWRTLVDGKAFGGYIETIEWHPDPSRRQLSFFVYHSGGNHRSAFLDREDSGLLLPPGPDRVHDFWGTWTPEGKGFLFYSNRQIMLYRQDTGKLESAPTALPGLPFWSRDGRTAGWLNKETEMKLRVLDLD